MTQHWPDRSDANRDKESDTELQSQSGHFKYQRGASPSGEAAMTGTMLHLIKWLPLRLIWTIRLSCDTSYSYQSGLLMHFTLYSPTWIIAQCPLSLVTSHPCDHIFSWCSLTYSNVINLFQMVYSVVIDLVLSTRNLTKVNTRKSICVSSWKEIVAFTSWKNPSIIKDFFNRKILIIDSNLWEAATSVMRRRHQLLSRSLHTSH